MSSSMHPQQCLLYASGRHLWALKSRRNLHSFRVSTWKTRWFRRCLFTPAPTWENDLLIFEKGLKPTNYTSRRELNSLKKPEKSAHGNLFLFFFRVGGGQELSSLGGIEGSNEFWSDLVIAVGCRAVLATNHNYCIPYPFKWSHVKNH